MLHLPQSFLKNQKVAKDFVRYLEKCEDRVQEIYKTKKGMNYDFFTKYIYNPIIFITFYIQTCTQVISFSYSFLDLTEPQRLQRIWVLYKVILEHPKVHDFLPG